MRRSSWVFSMLLASSALIACRTQQAESPASKQGPPLTESADQPAEAASDPAPDAPSSKTLQDTVTETPDSTLARPPMDDDRPKPKTKRREPRKRPGVTRGGDSEATGQSTPEKKDSIDCNRISEPGYRAKLASDGIDPDSIDCEEEELTP